MAAFYVTNFLKKSVNDLHLLDDYSASCKQYEHEDTHVFDLVAVSLVKGGTLS